MNASRLPPSKSKPEHPGPFVKRTILPVDVSVKEAAARMGIGRPALSNFLNGKASLSAEMAVRLEKTFGADREELLRMQAAFDEQSLHNDQRAIAVRAYAPSLLDITARQIEAWSEKHIKARQLLAVLLRRLVRSTGTNLSTLDFPAHDNAERPGWDGQTETDTATPWIPAGLSGWEFGCNEDPRAKAQKDYAARISSIPKDERKDITFVFVTPQNWPGKSEWVKAKKAEKNWRDVRVIDASDLEQWLEQSVPAQSWMADQLGIDRKGIVSLDRCWEKWAKVTDPELDKALFAGSVKAYKSKLDDWLKNPPDSPFVITADSKEEALAFLACVFENTGDPAGADYDRVVLLESLEALTNARRVSSNFIAIVADPQVEAALAGFHKNQHTIIFRSYSAGEDEPQISLDLLEYESFKVALTNMGVHEDDIARLERESGKSPTILRRRLSKIPEIRVPKWAQDGTLARKLIPLGLAGVWNAESDADREILSCLTSVKYDEVERSLRALGLEEQTPVWSVGKCRGVLSKIDVLYATSPLFIDQDLKDFFVAAQYVLCEQDPALELPASDRWAAHIYGKTRDHSPILRESICETLVLLAVHGDNLFKDRLGFNVEARVNKLISDLLTPLNATTWASQQHDLPRYAEAAPDVFLDILEGDLDSDSPQILELLKPGDSSLFGGCPRSGLLWALELLAWKPQRLARVATILARLSRNKIDDNWSNKPENSLHSILSAWMPQTAANIEQRISVLEKIAREFPEVGWKLCLDQFSANSRIGSYNSRPRWRNEAMGAGQPLREGRERYRFARKALDIALEWPNHTENTLGDLVEQMHGFDKKDQDAIWVLVETWAASTADEGKRAHLRERIRKFAFTRRGRRNTKDSGKAGARQAYKLLEPSDPVVRHQWLFAEHWVEETLEEIEDADFDYTKHGERIASQRAEALAEVWNSAGQDGLLRLSLGGNASYIVGMHAAEVVGTQVAADFLAKMLCQVPSDPDGRVLNCIAGFLVKLSDDERGRILTSLIDSYRVFSHDDDDKIVNLLRSAPFGQQTWQYLTSLPDRLTDRYWREVNPQWARQSPEELRTVIDQLLKYQRPRAALRVIHLDYKDIDTQSLIRLLKDVATCNAEPEGHYRFNSYEIVEILKLLNGRADASREELANLEFLYLQALDHSDYGIPNLQRQLAESPALFMQAIGLTYKRKGPGEDPPEWHVQDRSHVATQAHRFLTAARRIPGTEEDGTIDAKKLKSWIKEVRALCKIYGREVVGDHSIGELLAKAPADPDGLWPCEAVRIALEETAAKDITDGMAIGVYNLRGAHWRGEGGQQERELAAKYRNWAEQTAFDYPFVSRFLEKIAQTYDREASWHDTDANVRKRLNN